MSFKGGALHLQCNYGWEKNNAERNGARLHLPRDENVSVVIHTLVV